MPGLNIVDVYETDSSDNEENHLKLLSSVSQLDSTQRIKPAQRKEIASKVSEYNLSKGLPVGKNLIHVAELVEVLGKKPEHKIIANEIKSVTKKSQVLPKPLEKPTEERIKRSVGFEKVKKELRKWDAIVTRNALKDRIIFPLNNQSMIMENSSEFLSQFKAPTSLEEEISKVLMPEVQEEKKSDDEKFPLTFQEMMEKRREMAQLRARLSYKQTKAQRQSKIKSKKYHRLLKREKLRQELKEFERLQKTDPEAALKKLAELDKTRAIERASLRHRNTGKWAKSLTVRAKYDVETRKVLAEQLKMSRELTQKISQADSSGDEDTVEEPVEKTVSNINITDKPSTDNPWMLDVSKEVQDFVSDYKKFWSENGKEISQNELKEKKCYDKSDTNSNLMETERTLKNDKKIEKQKLTSKIKFSKKIKINPEETGICSNNTKVNSNKTENTKINSEKGVVPINIEVGVKNTKMNSKSTGVSPKNTKISSKNTEVCSKETKVSSESTEVQLKNTKLQAKKLGVGLKKAELRSKNIEVFEEEIEISPKNTEIRSKNTKINSKSTGVSPKNTKINSKKLGVGLKKAEVSLKNIEINSKNTVGSKETEVSSENTKINSKKTGVSSKKAEVRLQNTEVCPKKGTNSKKTEVNPKNRETKSKNTKMNSKKIRVDLRRAEMKLEKTETDIRKRKLSLTNVEISPKKSKVSMKKIKDSPKKKKLSESVHSTSGAWVVTPVADDSNDKIKIQSTDNDIDILFDELNDKLLNKATKKINKIQKSVKKKERKKKIKKKKSKTEFDLSLKNTTVSERPDMDVGLLEGPVENDVLETISVNPDVNTEAAPSIDPDKFIQIKPKKLNTHLPENITEGEDGIDDEKAQEKIIEEAFGDDDVMAEFNKMKKEEEKNSRVEIQTSLPGWGQWGGTGIVQRRRKKPLLVLNLPPRKDKLKRDVIINENENPNLKNHLVKEVPHPFKSVSAFEANIRAPIGRDWIPETAHQKLIQKQVVTKLGTIIEPMSEDEIVRMKNAAKSPYQGKKKKAKLKNN